MAEIVMKVVEDVPADDIGPEPILRWHDPALKVREVKEGLWQGGASEEGFGPLGSTGGQELSGENSIGCF